VVLDGKTVVVSGVGAGLGRETALAAARDGANVVLGARTESNLTKVAAEIDADRVAYAVTDITDASACENLVSVAVEKFGGIDALIHVAAKDDTFGGLDGADLELWRAVLDVNLIGTMRLTQAALPALSVKGGSVVIIGTQAAFSPALPQTAYAASKGALHAAMFSLAKELGRRKIRVNSVVPGWMWGPQVENYVKWQAQSKGVTEESVKARLDAKTALGEIAQDADVAEAAVFFASDRARMLTGQTLFVNGGEYFR
jgi:NAD(P)-dependent dehydrogenase (short-subunit alcohol dehydrogenase family)